MQNLNEIYYGTILWCNQNIQPLFYCDHQLILQHLTQHTNLFDLPYISNIKKQQLFYLTIITVPCLNREYILREKKHQLDSPLFTQRKVPGQTSLSERILLKKHQAEVDLIHFLQILLFHLKIMGARKGCLLITAILKRTFICLGVVVILEWSHNST